MRRKLLPLLEKEFNPKAVEHLAELAHLARKDEAFLSDTAKLRCDALSTFADGSYRIPIRDFASCSSEALTSRMIRMLTNKVRENAGELAALHVDAVRQLARSGENGKMLQLPGGVDVRRDNDALVFLPREKKNSTKKSSKKFSHEVELGGETSIALEEMGCVIRIRSIDWPTAGRDTSKSGGFALDEAKLNGPLVLRNMQPGDRMRPEGRQHAHKLSRLLNEKRISRWEREGWPVLENAKNIVWARGFVAAEFAATEHTQRAILVSEEPA